MEQGRFLNRLTREAMARTSGDYVDKALDEYAKIEELKRKNGLGKVYRFDIGKNTDGYSPLIQGVLEMADVAELSARNLIEYPDNHYELLREKLAERFRLRPEWFAFSAGLESMIDHVSRALLEPGDCFLLPVPNFDVFERCSSMGGARPVYRLLDQDGLRWTDVTTRLLLDDMEREKPKMIWVSNPINPTGQLIPLMEMEQLAERAARSGAVLVVDEAYGEYTDTDDEIISAARYLEYFPNLLVFRTFSKIYGIPSVRVGYAMCSSPDIIAGINLYRPCFPFSWFSFFVAQTACVDDTFLSESRSALAERKQDLYTGLESLENFEFLRSDTNTVMLRHRWMRVDEWTMYLETKGILVANLDRLPGIAGLGYVRITVRRREDNDYLIEACRELDINRPNPHRGTPASS